MVAKLKSEERDKAARIVALFSRLVHEWLTGDIRKAESTLSRLSEMGVHVKLRPCSVAGGAGE